MQITVRICALTATIFAAMAFSGIARADDNSDISHRIGGGVQYWRTIRQISHDSSFDRDGLSYIGSYQFVFGWIKLEADVEVFPKNFRASDNLSIHPMAFAMVGGIIYGGLGIGAVYTDDDTLDDEWSDPIMSLRAGLDLPILPNLRIDLNANYHFTEWADWNKFDTDTIILGAQARLAF